MITLANVQAQAANLGLTVEEDHVHGAYGDEWWRQEGYWIIDPATGDGPLPDDNFSTSLVEVAGKLVAIEMTRLGL